MAKLIFIDRDFLGQVYDLVIEKTKVGRSDENTLVLRHETVSSQHCEILTNGPEVIVRDLGSRNGTFINGVRFQGQRQVKSGQTIRFGNVEARLELAPDSSHDPDTDETAVRLHQKAMRGAAAGSKPPAPDPVARMGVDSGLPSDEPTILLPKSTLAELGKVRAAVETPTPPKPSKSKKGLVWILIVLGVIAGLWWLRSRT